MSRSGYPTFVTVNPDGTLTYDFDGHIHADGLDLDGGVSDSPPNDRKIQWTRLDDGSLLADIDGTMFDTGPVTGNVSRTRLRALTRDQARSAFLQAFAWQGDGSAGVIGSEVQSVADGISATVIRGGGGGASSFLRFLQGVRTNLVLFGRTAVPLAAGWATYGVAFPQAFPNTLTAFLFTIEVSNGASLISSELRGSGVNSATIDANSSVAQNGSIHWIAIGT